MTRRHPARAATVAARVQLCSRSFFNIILAPIATANTSPISLRRKCLTTAEVAERLGRGIPEQGIWASE